MFLISDDRLVIAWSSFRALTATSNYDNVAKIVKTCSSDADCTLDYRNDETICDDLMKICVHDCLIETDVMDRF